MEEKTRTKDEPKLSYTEIFKNFFLDKDVHESISELERIQKEENNEKENDHFIQNTLKQSFFQMIENDQNEKLASRQYCILGENVLSDLEVLDDYSNTQNTNPNNVLSMLSSSPSWNFANHKLKGSQFYLQNLLVNPIHDIPSLQKRQHTIQSIFQKEMQHKDELSASWDILQKNETKLCWFYDENKDVSGNLHDLVYLNYWLLQRMNKSDTFLTGYNLYRIIISPLIGIFTPILYVLVPYIVLRRKWKINIAFKDYLKMTLQMFLSSSSMMPSSIERFRKISIGFTIVFYFQGLFNSIELSRAIYRLTKLLVTKINSIINFLHHSVKINHLLGEFVNVEDFGYNSLFFDYKDSERDETYDFFDPQLPVEKQVLGGIDGEKFSIFSHFGKQLRFYRYLNLSRYKPLLCRIYLIDTLRSIGYLTLEHSERKMCYVNYDKSNGLYVNAEECFHPCLSEIPFDDIIKNDLIMSKNQEGSKNMLLTGPNAAGKSTYIKSVMLSILLAQSLTVSNAKSMTMSPFKFINTQINVADNKGKESLFEAEMFRCKKIFDVINSLHKDEYVVNSIDEIFNSTNMIEGTSASFAVANKLGQYDNVINIISTHFTFLSRLEKTKNYTNYKMTVDLDEHNNILGYPFKIQRGISRQFIALELLRQNGFDKDLIDEAVDIKNSFLDYKRLPKVNALPQRCDFREHSKE